MSKSSKSSRKAIIKRRRALARQRKRFAKIAFAVLALAVGALFVFASLNRAEIASEFAETDPNKAKGNPDASVLVVEYGDFQ